MNEEAKKWLDANVWDGEDRSGTGDRAIFSPDDLQELVDELLEHLNGTDIHTILSHMGR